MDAHQAIDLSQEAIRTAMVLAFPLLLAAVVAGVVVGLLQTITQIHDASVAAVPRLLVVGLVAMVCLPWLMSYLGDYASEVIRQIPALVTGQ